MFRMNHEIHRSKTLLTTTLLATLMLTALACVPTRVVWSPDGSKAIVWPEEYNRHIALLSADGKISPLMVVCPSTQPASTQPTTTTAAAPQKPELRPPSVWLDEKTLLISVRDKNSVSIRRFTLADNTLTAGSIIAASPNDVCDMRLSPDRKLLAFTCEAKSDKDHNANAFIVSLASTQPTQPLVENANTHWYIDFTPDSRSVICITRSTDDKIIGELRRIAVADDKGQLLSSFSQTTLAYVIFSELDRVRCLSDGRILFTSPHVSFPFTDDNNFESNMLCIIDPKYPTVIPALSAENAEKLATTNRRQGTSWLEPSPDGKYISLPTKDGCVFVVELATGTIIEAQPVDMKISENDIKLPTVPVWRNNDELTFIVPKNDKATPPIDCERLVIYNVKDKKARITIPLTTQPTSQPTTQPSAVDIGPQRPIAH